MMKNILKRRRQVNMQFLALALGFTGAAVGATSLGLNARQMDRVQAATVRDCSSNSIDFRSHNGGCGAATPSEFIRDLKQNDPGDMQAVYADARFGSLTPDKFDDFAKNAKMGIAHKDGRVVVDGKVVMTNAHSVGRQQFEGQHESMTIGGKKFFHSPTTTSFQSKSIPVMVSFNKNNEAETVILTACGNPMMGKKEVQKKEIVKKEVVKEKVVEVPKVVEKVVEVPKVVEKVVTPPALPKAGPENLLGVFAGTSAVGAIAHGLYMSRRNKD